VADAVQTSDNAASFQMTLQAGEQKIIPNIVDYLRQQGVTGIGASDSVFAGALFATVSSGDGRATEGRGGQVNSPRIGKDEMPFNPFQDFNEAWGKAEARDFPDWLLVGHGSAGRSRQLNHLGLTEADATTPSEEIGRCEVEGIPKLNQHVE
jgi:hypothetical protein